VGEFGEARDFKRLAGAFLLATVYHEHLRRAFGCFHDAGHASADAGQTEHPAHAFGHELARGLVCDGPDVR